MVACLIIVSTSGPDLSRFRLSLVRLVTRSAKARFGQVGNQVRKVKDQVGQGQGQELDNCPLSSFLPRYPRIRASNLCFNLFLISSVVGWIDACCWMGRRLLWLSFYLFNQCRRENFTIPCLSDFGFDITSQ